MQSLLALLRATRAQYRTLLLAHTTDTPPGIQASTNISPGPEYDHPALLSLIRMAEEAIEQPEDIAFAFESEERYHPGDISLLFTKRTVQHSVLDEALSIHSADQPYLHDFQNEANDLPEYIEQNAHRESHLSQGFSKPVCFSFPPPPISY